MTGLLIVLVVFGAFMLGYFHGRWIWRDPAVKSQEPEQEKTYTVRELRVNVMKPYECPVCGSDDPFAHMRCMRAGCTDGRDPR